ncbi:MAG: HlyC/CorC family transporter [Clostridia bacterium]|nr:HlyC/CorC family transporter [Clostridia bacterium]MBQ5798528.1 HlyC/CorC family transporter [Clostridia bacterium]
MLNYIIIAVCLICSAFFSASEISYASAGEVRLRCAAEEKGSLAARLALKIHADYDKALATILIGNNLVNIAAESVATVIVIAVLGEKMAWVATIAMTVLVLIFGEIVPKVVAKTMPETFATLFAIPLHALSIVTKPFVFLVDSALKLVSLIWKNNMEETPSVTEEELETIIDTVETEGVIDEDKCELIQSVFDFGDVQAYEIITPRVDMLSIDVDDTQEEMVETILNSSYSRIPFYKETPDHIVGVLHVNVALKELVDNPKADLTELLMPTVYVHKTMPLDDVLSTMRREHSHMAVVTDEYGGVMGLLTMEDVLEQLVGDIWDESDEIEPEIVELSEGQFEIDGDMRIEDFFHEIDFDDRDFDDDNATVGGFVVELLGRYAEFGDVATFENITFTVTEVEERRIIKLNVEVTPIEPETEE